MLEHQQVAGLLGNPGALLQLLCGFRLAS
jgi:hypothetical protein